MLPGNMYIRRYVSNNPMRFSIIRIAALACTCAAVGFIIHRRETKPKQPAFHSPTRLLRTMNLGVSRPHPPAPVSSRFVVSREPMAWPTEERTLEVGAEHGLREEPIDPDDARGELEAILLELEETNVPQPLARELLEAAQQLITTPRPDMNDSAAAKIHAENEGRLDEAETRFSTPDG